MARAAKKTTKSKKAAPKKAVFRPVRWSIKWVFRMGLLTAAVMLLAVVIFAVVNPPTTPYMFSEQRRLGGIDHQWVGLDEISPKFVRSVVAAEDANFCEHWGFDMSAIRDALEEGSGRGASTISQQVVKNVYLWQGRSWARKALEAVMTPLVEIVWSKRRILEVYLNVAEFGEGVFGVEAAARTYFRTAPSNLTANQSAVLAVVLPNPKKRLAANPTAFVRRRAAAVVDGAATILADGRAKCFES